MAEPGRTRPARPGRDAPAPLRDFARGLPAALLVGAAVGLVVGTVAGWHRFMAGFPLLLADALRTWLAAALAAAAGFLLVYELVAAALGRASAGRWRGLGATAFAAAVAGVPILAGIGYLANRRWGIHPAEVLEPYGLKRNLALVAAWAAATALVALALHRRRAGGGPRPLGRGRAILAGGLLAAVAALWIAVGAAFRAGGVDARPDVLVLLVDALRADHLGCYGYPRPTSPAIDALARDGVLFRQAIPASTFTKSSIASLFTGRFPYQHGVYWGSNRENPERITSDVLGADEVTLAEVLRAAGYLTAAWVQNSHLRGFMGYAQGFVDYHDQQGDAARIDRRFAGWLAGPGRRYPFFAYLHYIDLHDPYRPPPPYDTLFAPPGDVYSGVDFAEWGRFLAEVRSGERRLTPADIAQLEALYDGQIRALDDEVGRLLDRMKRLGLYDRTMIVLTSDHGDGFGEHGFIAHSTTPYEELVRVPLIVKLPGGRFAGREVGRQVRLVDVFPTVLGVTGVSAPAGGRPADLAGCSLLPLLDGEDTADRDPRCDVAVVEIAEEGSPPTVAIRAGGWKLIHRGDGGDELYDLRADPGERHDLAATETAKAEELRGLVLEVIAKRKERRSEQIQLDPRTIEELKALGYVK